MIRIATLPCLYDVKGSQPRPPHIHHRPRMEVQRGPLQVSWLWCRREAEGKNVNVNLEYSATICIFAASKLISNVQD